MKRRLCVVCAFKRGVASSCNERAVRVQQAQQRAVRVPATPKQKMGLEKEKSETSVIMDEEEFNRSIEPILGKKLHVYSPEPDRDHKDINAHLKVGFEDIIAEPISTHSFDRVWIGSHAVFELVKYVFYLILTTFLAVPMAFVFGIVFAILSCIHIWVVIPTAHGCMMTLAPSQVIWTSFVDMFIRPLFFSIGRCLSSINIKTMQN